MAAVPSGPSWDTTPHYTQSKYVSKYFKLHLFCYHNFCIDELHVNSLLHVSIETFCRE
jgi:hypothetical protein